MGRTLPRSMRRKGDLAKIVELLGDGEWHSVLDLAETVGCGTRRIAHLCGSLELEKARIHCSTRYIAWYRLPPDETESP